MAPGTLLQGIILSLPQIAHRITGHTPLDAWLPRSGRIGVHMGQSCTFVSHHLEILHNAAIHFTYLCKYESLLWCCYVLQLVNNCSKSMAFIVSISVIISHVF